VVEGAGDGKGWPSGGEPGEQPVPATPRKATLVDLFAELKRRRVFRVVVGYGIFAFAMLQVAEPLMHGLYLPEWVLTVVIAALAIGFPVALILAWLYDLTAQGVQRTRSAKDSSEIHFSRRRLAALLIVAGVVGALPGVGWYLLRGRSGASAGTEVVAISAAARPATEAAPSAQRWLVPVGTSPVRGPDDALVTIVEFADFQCPYSKQAEPVLRRLEARFPNKLRIAWKNYPLSVHSDADAAAQLAGEALRQRGVAGFWQAHDRLLAMSPRVGRANLEALAQELGLDLAEARKAIATERYRDAVDADVEALARVGPIGTPTFFVNGRMVVGEGEEELGQAVAEALEEARRAMASGVPPGRLYDELQKGARAVGQPTPRVALPDPGRRPARGGPAARAITVHEFCDLSLTRCAWFEPVLRRTLQGYGDEVRLVWWDVGDPLRAESRRARRAALAADATPGGFWKLHDALLADLRTDDFQPPAPEKLALPALREHARRQGIDLATFDYAMGLDEETTAEREEVEQARGLGLRPGTLVIDGEPLSGFDPAHLWRKAINQALARRK